ncbi:MAG TPA: hypothetical protein VN083_02635, partial [Vicinamibacteria bacterium]|nr:hypothetical protein [Vicinamibacteria bacterium]
MSRGARSLLVVLLATAFARGAVIIAYTTVWWDTPTLSHLVADLATWPAFFLKVRAGLVPYVDFPKEYPVGAALLYWGLAFVVNPLDLREITWVHGIFMSVGDILGAAVFYRIVERAAPRWALFLSLVFVLNLTALLLSPLRFEGWVVLLALLGYRFHREGRPLVATFFWSLGCALKWFPAFFIAAQEWKALAAEGRRTQWVRSGLVFVGVTAALNLPFAIADYRAQGNLQAWLSPYLFHVNRPLYWDTLLGVGELWLGPLSLERYGSLWTLALVGVALVCAPRMSVAAKGTLMLVAALILNRVYSAQFHLWFYPFLLLSLVRSPESLDRRLLVLFVTLDALNVLVYPFSFVRAYAELGGFAPFAAVERGQLWTTVFSAAIVLRTAALALVAWALLRQGVPEREVSPPR